MDKLNILRFGFALGVSMALIRMGCVFVIMTVPREKAIEFFNSLLCGADVTPIMRMDMSPSLMALGIVEIFALAWLFGGLVAGLYNVTARLAR